MIIGYWKRHLMTRRRYELRGSARDLTRPVDFRVKTSTFDVKDLRRVLERLRGREASTRQNPQSAVVPRSVTGLPAACLDVPGCTCYSRIRGRWRPLGKARGWNFRPALHNIWWRPSGASLPLGLSNVDGTPCDSFPAGRGGDAFFLFFTFMLHAYPHYTSFMELYQKEALLLRWGRVF